MKITRGSKIKEVLAFDEEKMIATLMWLAPEFERLRYPNLRRAMAGRISVSASQNKSFDPLHKLPRGTTGGCTANPSQILL